jgi:hypothetical protein
MLKRLGRQTRRLSIDVWGDKPDHRQGKNWYGCCKLNVQLTMVTSLSTFALSSFRTAIAAIFCGKKMTSQRCQPELSAMNAEAWQTAR